VALSPSSSTISSSSLPSPQLTGSGLLPGLPGVPGGPIGPSGPGRPCVQRELNPLLRGDQCSKVLLDVRLSRLLRQLHQVLAGLLHLGDLALRGVLVLPGGKRGKWLPAWWTFSPFPPQLQQVLLLQLTPSFLSVPLVPQVRGDPAGVLQDDLLEDQPDRDRPSLKTDVRKRWKEKMNQSLPFHPSLRRPRPLRVDL
jgi:hypothetical protein